MAGNQQIFQNAMNNGNSAAWDQNWELASRYYIAALEEFPNNPTALINLGLALFERHEYDQALMVYVMAGNILGPRPQAVPRKGSVRPQTYANLSDDQFGRLPTRQAER